MPPIEALHYRDRAESFIRLMKVGLDREMIEEWFESSLDAYESAVALLAVHSAISFADGALVSLTGERSTAQNHHEAARRLGRACGEARRDQGGIRHFTWLVDRKDDFAYAERRLSAGQASLAALHAERFQSWFYNTFPEMLPEVPDD